MGAIECRMRSPRLGMKSSFQTIFKPSAIVCSRPMTRSLNPSAGTLEAASSPVAASKTARVVGAAKNSVGLRDGERSEPRKA